MRFFYTVVVMDDIVMHNKPAIVRFGDILVENFIVGRFDKRNLLLQLCLGRIC